MQGETTTNMITVKLDWLIIGTITCTPQQVWRLPVYRNVSPAEPKNFHFLRLKLKSTSQYPAKARTKAEPAKKRNFAKLASG